MKTQKQAANKILWFFAIGQLGWSILSGIITNWLVFFYQPSTQAIKDGAPLHITQGAVLGGLTVIGLIAAVGRIFDAVTDPWIASCSDRCRHRLGRRIPFLRYAAVPLGIITVLVFFSPAEGIKPVNSVFLLAMDLLFYLFMTLYCTPFNALIPELGRTQEARVNLSTFISITYFVGTAISYMVPNLAGILEPKLGYSGSYRAAIAVFAVLAVICMLVPAFTIDEHEYADTTPCDSKMFASLGKTFRNGEFRKFVTSDILYWIALTMFQTGLPFYITVLMGLKSGMSFVLFAVMTVISLAFYVPVNLLAQKFGKKKIVQWAFVAFAAVFALTTFCGMWGLSGMVWGVLIAALAAIPMAALGILPQAVVADIAEADRITTGENREGMFYAARTFAFKMGQSVAMLVFTSVAKIGSNGAGYRLSAIIAAVLCLAGGIVFFSYNEKKTIGIIEAGRAGK